MGQPKDYGDFNEAFLNADLTFDDNGIYWVYAGETIEDNLDVYRQNVH